MSSEVEVPPILIPPTPLTLDMANLSQPSTSSQVGGSASASPGAADLERLLPGAVASLMDEVVAEVVFSAHRSAALGLGWLDSPPEGKPLCTTPGMDVFGQPSVLSGKGGRGQECVCPQCGRSLSAPRFAPHLEKCMGMGRNSFRQANRRLAASAASRSAAVFEEVEEELESEEETPPSPDDFHPPELDEDDEDWISVRKRRPKRRPLKKVRPPPIAAPSTLPPDDDDAFLLNEFLQTDPTTTAADASVGKGRVRKLSGSNASNSNDTNGFEDNSRDAFDEFPPPPPKADNLFLLDH